MILLDTHVVSEPLRPAPDARVVAWIDAQPLDSRPPVSRSSTPGGCEGGARPRAQASGPSQAQAEATGAVAVNEPPARYGEPLLMRPRLGQGSFRVAVTEAYRRKCAITGESTLLALEAAHIVPYAEDGAHDVRNGLLLRADFHRLFDAGLVSVTPDMTIRVSPRIREAWFNGKAYYRMDGQPLTVTPTRPEYRPDPDRLQWHLTNRFQA